MNNPLTGVGWRDVVVSYPWVSTINKIANRSGVTRLTGDTAYVMTDYSGQHANSPFDVISLLIVDFAQSKDWEVLRSRVRSNHLPDGRRMSYKGMNDQHRRDALIPFLNAANALHGLCVTIVVNKRISDLCYETEFLAKMSNLGMDLEARWKLKQFKMMLRIANFVTIFIAGVIRSGQNVYWVSDEDQIFANDSYSRDVSKIMGKLSGMYIPFPVGQLGVGTTRIDPRDRIEEDLAAIPDLVAGALADVTGALHRNTNNSFTGTLAHLVPDTIPTKANIISDWLQHDRSTLQRLNLIFNTLPSGGYSVGKFNITNS